MLKVALIAIGCCAALLPSRAFGQASADNCSRVLESRLAERFEAARKKAAVEARPIYGCDDRRNLYDPQVTVHQKRGAQATAILVHTNQLEPKGTAFELSDNGAGRCSPEAAAAA